MKETQLKKNKIHHKLIATEQVIEKILLEFYRKKYPEEEVVDNRSCVIAKKLDLTEVLVNNVLDREGERILNDINKRISEKNTGFISNK